MYPPAISTPAPASAPTPNLLPTWLFKGREITQDLKDKAEVYYGDETCRAKFAWLLEEIGLPNRLLIVEEIEECGYVKDTGFVWIKQKKQRDYSRFDNIVVCYDQEVTAYVEHKKIKNLTGVKAKEFLIWITLSEIHVDANNRAGSITFKTPAGLSKSFPLSLFRFEAIVARGEEEEVKDVADHQAVGRN